MIFQGYLFGCSTNKRAVAIYKKGYRTKLIVKGMDGLRVHGYHRPEMNSEDLGQWLADAMGDSIIGDSVSQLEAVLKGLKL